MLGSRGSVLTALTAQVAAGGPVTVTHPEVRRYFMTADEAVQLVLQAAVIGRSGEVLVLDMGEQIKIADMARRLVAAVPGQVDIVYTGLRPGEKLTEDLLSAGEPDERPCHPLIRQVPVSPLAPEPVTSLDPGREPGHVRADLSYCASIAAHGGQARSAAETPGKDAADQPAPAMPGSHLVTGHPVHVGHPRATGDHARPARDTQPGLVRQVPADAACADHDADPAAGVLTGLPDSS